jgi:hypothetical protein
MSLIGTPYLFETQRFCKNNQVPKEKTPRVAWGFYKTKKLAQEEGLEPPTQRLTAACSTD